MATSGIVRRGGLAALAGGTLWVVAFGGAQLPPFQLTGLVALPSLLLIVGLVGLRARGVTRPGPVSTAGFALALLGSLLLAYGSTGELVVSGTVGGIGYGPFLFTGIAFGALLLGLGTAIVALSTILADVLPRLSPIPLLAGALGVSVAGMLGVARQLLVGPSNDMFPLQEPPLLVLWAVFGLGWVWLGYLLYSEQVRGALAADAIAREPAPS